MPDVGDIFVFPIVVVARAIAREPGVFGAAQLLGSGENGWFASALDFFGPTHGVPTDAPPLSRLAVEALPRRRGHILAHGTTIPSTWTSAGNGPLFSRKAELAELYASSTQQGPDKQVASGKLGVLPTGLGSIQRALGVEWRFRFELDDVLADMNLGGRGIHKRHIPPPWASIVSRDVRGDFPEGFGGLVQDAYDGLVSAGQVKPSRAELKRSLRAYFRKLRAHRMSSEYREEVFRLALDVATSLGSTEAFVHEVADSVE